VLCWLVFSSVTNKFISLEYCNELKADLAETGIAIADGQNPITRMSVLVCGGNQGTVFIDELVAAAPTEEGGGQRQDEQDRLNLRTLQNSTPVPINLVATK
jgi:hypothetical protein